MTLGKRLSYYVEKQGFTKKSFCEKFSFEYNNMVSVMADKRPLGINILNQIHFALPNMNVHWLLYEEGKVEIETKENYSFLKDLNIDFLKEPDSIYEDSSDLFENLLLKYLERKKIKNKINEIVK